MTSTEQDNELDVILAKHNGELGVTWEDPDIVTPDTKQAILDWHNKQTLELLDRLEAKLSHFGHDATVNIEAERKRINKTEKQ